MAIQYYNEDFKRLNLNGSMALITSKLAGHEQEFIKIVSEGHFDVTNHSMTHPKFPLVVDTVALENEIDGSQQLLKSIFKGQDVITMANPFVANCNLSDSIIIKRHFAARNGGTGYNSLHPTENEWYRLKYVSTYNYDKNVSSTALDLNTAVNTALKGGKWLIILAHGLGNGRNSIPKEEITSHFEYVAAKSDSVWCGTFNDVTKYIREKQHAMIAIKETNSSKIVVSLSHDLDANIFIFPLTIKTEVPSKWKNVKVTQNGKSKMIRVKNTNGISSVYYEAIPNQGDITLGCY